MSDFVHHTSCPKCGSSDGRAVYQGGSSWCFVCKSYSRGSVNDNLKRVPKGARIRSLPDDLGREFPADGIEWLGKYGISLETAWKQGVQGSKCQNRLYFVWEDGAGSVLGWQARTFYSNGPKYLTSGETETIIPIYRRRTDGSAGEFQEKFNETNLLILTEDCLSAIKCVEALGSPRIDAMPCLTSSLATSKLKRLAGLYGAFLVWLDGDMFDNAQKMARQLQMLGCEARAIWTKDDPKVYDCVTIREILLTGRAS